MSRFKKAMLPLVIDVFELSIWDAMEVRAPVFHHDKGQCGTN